MQLFIRVQLWDLASASNDLPIHLVKTNLLQLTLHNEMLKTSDLFIKNLRKKDKYDLTTPIFVAKLNLKPKKNEKIKFAIIQNLN